MTNYAEVLEAARAASRAFAVAQQAYRTGQIGDAEFLAAKATYTASEVAFTVARGEAV